METRIVGCIILVIPALAIPPYPPEYLPQYPPQQFPQGNQYYDPDCPPTNVAASVSNESDDMGSMSIQSHARILSAWIENLPKHLKRGAEKMHAEWILRAQAREAKLAAREAKLANELAAIKKEWEECQDPIFLRSLLDLFVSKHYPEWYGQQTEKKGEKWDRALLNVMDMVISKIKYLLSRDRTGVNEEYFKKNFIHRSYWSEGDEVHPRSLSDFDAEVIRKCVKATFVGSETIERIVNIMIEDVRGNASAVHLLLEEYDIHDKEVSPDEERRLTLYKVLKIANLQPNFNDEMKLKENFMERNPICVWYNEKVNTAYILFPSFSEVYSAWEAAKKDAVLYTEGGQASNIAIINRYTDIPDYKTLCTIKVPCEVDEGLDQAFSSENYIPKSNRKRYATLYEYRGIFDAVMALQKNKKNLKNFCPGTKKVSAEMQLIKNLQ